MVVVLAFLQHCIGDCNLPRVLASVLVVGGDVVHVHVGLNGAHETERKQMTVVTANDVLCHEL